MSGSSDLAMAMRRALDAPLGAPLGAVFHAPLVTTIVADAADHDRLVVVIPELLVALERVGVPRGRVMLLLATFGAPATRLQTRALRDALGVPVVAHDPARAAWWQVSPAGPVFDDELRETEALVLAGDAGEALLDPGLAPVRARERWSIAAPHVRARIAREACEAMPADFAIRWHTETGRAWAGEPARVAECLAPPDGAAPSTRGTER